MGLPSVYDQPKTELVTAVVVPKTAWRPPCRLGGTWIRLWPTPAGLGVRQRNATARRGHARTQFHVARFWMANTCFMGRGFRATECQVAPCSSV